MPSKGKIVIKVPQWYLSASVEQGNNSNQMSSVYMLEL